MKLSDDHEIKITLHFPDEKFVTLLDIAHAQDKSVQTLIMEIIDRWILQF